MAEAKLCAVEGCGKRVFARKLCVKHYTESRADSLPRCSVDGCDRPKHGRGLCKMHYRRMARHGDPSARKRVANGELAEWIARHSDWDGDGCLFWPFWRDKHGYGPSRLMCAAAHGDPEEPEMQAAHSCGRGHEGCVHPKHLRWATRLENQSEMVEHGNSQAGEKNWNAKLTEDDVRTIRGEIGKRSLRSIGRSYGVSHEIIRKIRDRKLWNAVE